jgi:negative regulator of sigma-B (phosphoserine phosphatase)
VATLRHPLEWGAAIFTLQGEAESGDRYAVASSDTGIVVAAIDGLGHGTEAAHASELAARILRLDPQESVVTLVARCHEGLRSTRGVVMSLASFNTRDETMTWLGVGNVEGRLVRAGLAPRDSRPGEPRTLQQPVEVERRRAERRESSRSEFLLLRAGVVGSHLPPLDSALLPLHLGDTLLLATDGVALPDEDHVGTDERPQEIAERILSAHKKGTDDALVVVARWVGTPG